MDADAEAGEFALWDRACQGDQSAFGAIFDLHKDRVFRHAFRLLADRHDAEDVLGAVFFELWRKRRSVHVARGSVLPWLLVTATHTASNLQRATRRYQLLLSRLPHEESEPSAEEEAFLRSNVLDPVLSDLIDRLGPVDRSIVTLVMIEDYSISEAADVLGIGSGAARTRLSRLRTKLRGDLGESSSRSLAVEGNGS